MAVADRRSNASVDRRVRERRARQVGIPEKFSRRVVVEHVRPAVDGGRFPIKRTVGERVHVAATIFADGHDVIAAVVRHRFVRGWEDGWQESPLVLADEGTDEWTGSFDVGDCLGWHEYQIFAWVDRFLTWRRDLRLKAAAGQDVSLELLEGSLIVRDASSHAAQIGEGQRDAAWLLDRADALNDRTSTDARIAAAMQPELAAAMAQYADRSRATRSDTLRAWVDRERARFGAWYEMFPRSSGVDEARGGTFHDAIVELPRIADLGFDVLYVPPIHPIGGTFRKGRNNALVAEPGDPGSPWAIGSAAGGHTAVDPGLGTLDDFETFRSTAERLGLEVAIDLAWQCSPDHPWVEQHPDWFRRRPDGTIKHAENPPKKYQDIYPFDFECENWRALWDALLAVTLFWVARGVKIFRVDNPHTKTLNFWQWMIAKVHERHPDVLFLSEAFTRPAVMKYLAKAGFTQSYTYFTWRNTRAELTDYFVELTKGDASEYLRPNLFANTPDILHAYLQHGGRPAFEARLLLAATLGASYGIYSGFELGESRALKPGSEEYAESEKYQIRRRDWTAPGNINDLVCRVNRIRRAHPALQYDSTLRFHPTDNPDIIAYTKSAPDGAETILTVVNLDPHHMQHGHVDAGVDAGRFTALDLLDDAAYSWRRGWNYVRFDPGVRQGHILCLQTART